MILGPGWILSDELTRWRITYETDHHLNRDHPFSTISVDLLVSAYCNHEVALVIASTSYGVFESRTTAHGLIIPEAALNRNPTLSHSPALDLSPVFSPKSPNLSPVLKHCPELDLIPALSPRSPDLSPVLNHSPTIASSPTLAHTQPPPGSVSPLAFSSYASDGPVPGGSQSPGAAAPVSQATPAVTKGKRKSKSQNQCPGEKGAKKSRRSVRLADRIGE